MLDAMCRLMSTKAACRRWPLAVFFNILDVAGINAWIIGLVRSLARACQDEISSTNCRVSWCVLQRRTVTRQWICSNRGSTVRSRRSATATELLLCASVVIVQCAANVWQKSAQCANKNMVL